MTNRGHTKPWSLLADSTPGANGKENKTSALGSSIALLVTGEKPLEEGGRSILFANNNRMVESREREENDGGTPQGCLEPGYEW